MIALYAAAGLLLALVHGVLIAPRLPEPPDSEALGKLAYSALATPRRVAILVAVVLVAQAALLLPAGQLRPAWFVYGSAVAGLIWVDGLTTWLPTTLTWLASAEMVAAVAVVSWLSGDWQTAAGMAVGGAAAAGLLWVFWRLSRGGIGFGITLAIDDDDFLVEIDVLQRVALVEAVALRVELTECGHYSSSSSLLRNATGMTCRMIVAG